MITKEDLKDCTNLVDLRDLVIAYGYEHECEYYGETDYLIIANQLSGYDCLHNDLKQQLKPVVEFLRAAETRRLELEGS